ncbi:uncharacterized protein METZ01_LOCUS237767, partial [marine metagenome]
MKISFSTGQGPKGIIFDTEQIS